MYDDEGAYGYDDFGRDDDYNIFEENQLAMDNEGGYDDWEEEDDSDDRDFDDGYYEDMQDYDY